MYSQEEKKHFVEVSESLKKYRRADLVDEDGKSILDKLYVDLLEGNVILNKCLLDNTTFLIGRKGTGKSTLFLKLESEYRKKKGYCPCYVDVKTVFESSQAQAINNQYLVEFFEQEYMQKYLLGRNFIQNVLKTIYEEIDKQYRSLPEVMVAALSGNTKETIKQKLEDLMNKIESNEVFKSVEVPVLQQIRKQKNVKNKESQINISKVGAEVGGHGVSVKSNVNSSKASNISNEDELLESNEYTDIYLKIFEIKDVIVEVKDILKKMQINKLILLLDDVSEIDSDALKMFIDTIVTPLNNWSEEFVKFKIAFYPSRVHFGNIDPGKIDVINLDFYNLYSEFDVSKMEENAINFTERLLKNHFAYYSISIEKFFDTKLNMSDVYTLFFQTTMNVPRIMGYLLSYLYQSVIIYNRSITKSDIEAAAEKYYDEKIDAYFKSSTYCLLSLDEKRDIVQLKKIRDAIVTRSKEIKSQIMKGELNGKLYLKSSPYSSHFHIIQTSDKYLDSLELNHFITKYEERTNRDGKKTNVYCINYGLCKKNNILWGKSKGSEYRTYFIERPFNYTNLVLEQIKEIKTIRCTNSNCGRIFSESDLNGLKFTGFRCPSCFGEVVIESIIDESITQDFVSESELPLLSKVELEILIELKSKEKYILAREIAEEVDINSQRVWRICKKLEEEKGVVERQRNGLLYEYRISENGKKYFD